MVNIFHEPNLFQNKGNNLYTIFVPPDNFSMKELIKIYCLNFMEILLFETIVLTVNG